MTYHQIFNKVIISTPFSTLKDVYSPQWTKMKIIKGRNTKDVGKRKRKG